MHYYYIISQFFFKYNQNPVLSSIKTYHRIIEENNTTDATSGTETAYISVKSEFIPICQWGSCLSIVNFVCSIISIFVCPFALWIWPLHCLSLKLRLLITPLVSSNFSDFISSCLLGAAANSLFPPEIMWFIKARGTRASRHPDWLCIWFVLHNQRSL